MHSVPNCLQTPSQTEPLEACLSPAYSPPSSPFDFDIDFLVNDSITNSCSSNWEIPSSLLQKVDDNQSEADSAFVDQVPTSPSMYSLDSDVLSPTMFSPSGNNKKQQPNNEMGSYDQQHQLVTKQRFVPTASPAPPASPYSPACRPNRRLSSTDSGKTATSMTSSMSSGCLSLQDSLNEYDEVQQRVKQEHEAYNLPPIPSSLMVTPVQQSKPAETPLLRQVLESSDSFHGSFEVRKIQRELSKDSTEEFVKNVSQDPAISMAMEQYRKDIETTSQILSISQGKEGFFPCLTEMTFSIAFLPDPIHWTVEDLNKWTTWYQQQYNMPLAFKPFENLDGRAVCQLREEDFVRHFPQVLLQTG